MAPAKNLREILEKGVVHVKFFISVFIHANLPVVNYSNSSALILHPKNSPWFEDNRRRRLAVAGMQLALPVSKKKKQELLTSVRRHLFCK